MLVTCPKCECKARFASSKAIDKETREAYWQCMNLNCGTVFVTHTLVSKVVDVAVVEARNVSTMISL